MKSLASLFLILALCLWPVEMIFARLDNADTADLKAQEKADKEKAEKEAKEAAEKAKESAAAARDAAARGDVAGAQKAAGEAKSAADRASTASGKAGSGTASQAASEAAAAAETAEAMVEAAKAISEANTKGVPVDVDRTISQYADTNTYSVNKDSQSGTVVGRNTKYSGPVDKVQNYEAQWEIDNVNPGININSAPVNANNLVTAFNHVANNIIGNTAVVAGELLGIKSAMATPSNVTPGSPNQVTVGVKTVVTKDAAAYARYQAEVAPAKAALEKASNDLNKAYEVNDQQAIDKAFNDLDKAAEEMKSVAQEHFGVAAQRVSLATDGGTTNTRGPGSTNPGGKPTGTNEQGTTNTAYSYDNKTNTFRGNNDNRDYTPGQVNLGEVAQKITDTAKNIAARAPAGSVTVVDAANRTVSVIDSANGKINTYDSEGKEVPKISSLQNPIQPANTFTNTNLGNYKTVKVVQNTPVVEVMTGKTNLGAVPETVKNKATNNGYSISSPAQVVALGFSHEISAKSREEILAAYKNDPSFKTLDSEVIREVGGIIGAIAGEAARKNHTITEQIIVREYLSSVTVDEGAYSTMKNRTTREALTALAEAMTDGSLSNARGLGVTAPVTKANHFYASYITPNWSYDIVNPTEVGKYTKTVVGYIPRETNPIAEGTQAAFNRTSNLGNSNSLYNKDSSFVVSVKAPGPSMTYPGSLSADLTPAELASYYGTSPASTDAVSSDSPSTGTSPRTVGPESTAEEVLSFWSKRNGVNANVENVNPELLHSISMGVERFEASNPNYRVEIQGPSSGMRYSGSVRNHGKQADGLGGALDMVLVNKTTGKRVTNHSYAKYKGELSVGEAAPLYQKLFNETVVAAYKLDPSLAKGLRFGGYFSSSNPMDLMHIDKRGFAGMAGGSILNGFTKEQMSQYKITANNPLGSWDKVAELAKEIYDSPEYQNIIPNQPLTESEQNQNVAPEEQNASTGNQRRTETGLSDRVATTILEQAERLGLPISKNPRAKDLLKKVLETAITHSIPLPAAIALTVAGDKRAEDILKEIFSGEGGNPTGEGIDNLIDDDGDEDPCENETSSTSPACMDKKQQSAAAWLGLSGGQLNQDISEMILAGLAWLTPGEDHSSQAPITTAVENYIPVTIKVDLKNRDIELSRPDIIKALEAYSAGEEMSDEDIEGYLDLPLGETPVIFGDNGEIVYSNGLYSPIVNSTDDTRYVYNVEVIDENGNTLDLGANNKSSDGIGELIQNLFSDNSAFVLEMVEKVEYTLIDPDENASSDEYYNYVITLKDGRTRQAKMPQYSSLENMRMHFSRIGFQGDVLALIGMAAEGSLEDNQSLASRFLSWTKETVTNLFGGEEETATPNTLLPVFSNNVTADNIQSVFIYPNAEVACPNTADYNNVGYKYVALVKDSDDPDQATMIVAERCGNGNELTMAVETAHDLEATYGIRGAYSDDLLEKTYVREEEADLVAGLTPVTLKAADSNPVPPIPEIPTPTETATSTGSLPNLTNEVTLEVKAVSADGTVATDWSRVQSLTIKPTTQLYFRWNGNAYQQCLPFLQDGGNYALTRQDRTMLVGNTETEKYNVTERSATYRVECGGQRNNEFGVDERKIEVTVQ